MKWIPSLYELIGLTIVQAAIDVQLKKKFLRIQTVGVELSASFSHHIFTYLCMGVVIPGMIIRICQGHTGRKPEFHRSDKIAISLIWIGGFFRLILTMTNPEKSVIWIAVAGILWSLCFMILAVRLIPFILQARVDGKEH